MKNKKKEINWINILGKNGKIKKRRDIPKEIYKKGAA